VEGGTDGALTAEASAAKRKEIAAAIRADAATQTGNPLAYLLRLAESLVYEHDAKTYAQVDKLAGSYVASVKGLPAGELEKRKNEITGVLRVFRYLAKWKIAPAEFAPLAALDRIEKTQGWDQPKK
jgi:hypothetical protein